MKQISLIVALLPLMMAAQPKNARFKLSGDLSKVNASVEWVYLQYLVNGDWKTDSVKPENDKYRFYGTLPEPQTGRLRVKYTAGDDGKIPAFKSSRDLAIIFLQKGKIKVASADSFSQVKVTGSAAHRDYQRLMTIAKPFNERMEKLYAQYSEHRKNKEDDGMKKTEKEIDALNDEIKESVYAAFVRANPASPVALYAVRQYAGWEIVPEKSEPLFNLLPVSVQRWPSAIELKENIGIAKKTAIGRTAIEFVQNDTTGKPVALSSFRGKYLLIDFWASWCGPCRVENPHVVKAFQKYRDKGFFILGVSLDRPGQKDKWLKAIYDDQLYWTHVSDLKFWQNEVAVEYGIRAIPQNLLLDPDGRIIAKNLRGEELDKKLEEFIVEGKKAF